AWQNFNENINGSIEPGKLADFVVLAENPLTVDAVKIKDIQVLQTVIGGKTAYSR
ncbi:MAG: amidohydrolase family protein, partial [Acidobacteria bacterium]|nr:amidohydrolase family protein [Acidobacteriota bacterium]